MEHNADFKHIVRVAETDLDGNKPLARALRKIKGIGYSFSNAISGLTGLDRKKKVGDLSEKEIELISDTIKSPNVPEWMLNRRRDMETNKSFHLVSSKLKFQKDVDIKNLKKIRCRRGIRHGQGLPVRGQRTKAHFRKGRAVGVVKRAQTAPAKADKK